jgi:hypothetical protein
LTKSIEPENIWLLFFKCIRPRSDEIPNLLTAYNIILY